MTTAELLTTIRAEIKRRINLYSQTDWKEVWIVNTYMSVLSFLDTLESEKPMNQEGLEEEIREYMSNEDNNPFDWDWRDKRDCARHFAQWGAEHLKK